MKKLLLPPICMALLLTGCAASVPPVAAPSPSETAVTFTDSLGREVTVDRPERVAVLIGSFADIWCLAGGKDSLAAAANDAWTSFDLGLDEDVVDELLLAAEPDLVIASSNTAAQVELLDTFEQMGLNTAYFTVSSFPEYLNMLDICTQITGCREFYRTYGTDIQAQVDDARQRADGSAPSVLYIRSTGSSCKVKGSQDFLLGEMLSDLGCVNVADSETSLLEELSLESILAADPDYSFVVLQGSDAADAQETLEKTLLSNPAWGSLRAVQEGRFHTLEHSLYNLKPNARWGEAYEKLADILYP